MVASLHRGRSSGVFSERRAHASHDRKECHEYLCVSALGISVASIACKRASSLAWRHGAPAPSVKSGVVRKQFDNESVVDTPAPPNVACRNSGDILGAAFSGIRLPQLDAAAAAAAVSAFGSTEVGSEGSNFSLDTIYNRGKTLLWDLLQVITGKDV